MPYKMIEMPEECEKRIDAYVRALVLEITDTAFKMLEGLDTSPVQHEALIYHLTLDVISTFINLVLDAVEMGKKRLIEYEM